MLQASDCPQTYSRMIDECRGIHLFAHKLKYTPQKSS